MNVIVVVLRNSGTTYRNYFEAHIFRSTRRIQQPLYHLYMWNTSRDMDNVLNEGSPNFYQKMDEKKLKNWNCIENGYKLSSSHSKSFQLLPSFSEHLPWCAIAFWPIFLNRFAKFGLGYASQTFLDFCILIHFWSIRTITGLSHQVGQRQDRLLSPMWLSLFFCKI